MIRLRGDIKLDIINITTPNELTHFTENWWEMRAITGLYQPKNELHFYQT